MEDLMAAPKKFSKNPVVSTPATPASSPNFVRSEVKASGTPKVSASAPRMITRDLIEKRAYEIYASRGYAHGDPDADWHEAERQLKAGL
jgi:hypothetical protein